MHCRSPHRPSLWLFAAVATWCALPGCGRVTIASVYDLDGSADGTDEADGLVHNDGGSDAVDTAIGATCTQDEDCADLEGTGPCLTGTCTADGCKVVPLPAKASCDDDAIDEACNVGVCDDAGTCQAQARPDATPCDADGSPCTVNDACVSGSCQPGESFDCSAGATACRVGACSVGDDGKPACALKDLPAGAPCDDGLYCTVGQTCDDKGSCSPGEPRSCAEASGPCTDGVCDDDKDACVAKPKATGLPCDDGLFCSESEACNDAGVCAMTKARSCPNAFASCQIGVCDETNGACTLGLAPAATACDDSDPCTVGDSCSATGTCVGGSAKVCKGDACNAAACDSTSGQCKLVPLQSGIACDDGLGCTLNDSCDGKGICKAGGWDKSCTCAADADCDDGNACTTDTCGTAGCTFAVESGKACDDGDPCSSTSICDAGGGCVASKLFDCSGASNGCNDAICNGDSGSATCELVPRPSGTACDDDQPCTTADTCDGQGTCAGLTKDCVSTVPCTFSTCNPKTGSCESKPAAPGTACEDGNPCTGGDNCDAAGGCSPGGVLPDFAACDDGNAATSADMCVSKVCKGFSLVATPGPVADVAYSAAAKSFFVAAPAAAAAQDQAAADWQIWRASAGVTGGDAIKLESQAKLGPQTPALRAIAGNAASGNEGQIWLLYQSAGVWKWTPSLSNTLAAQVAKGYGAGASAVQWLDVDTDVQGSLVHATLAGWSDSNGGVMAHCNGAANGNGSFVCIVTKYTQAIRPFGAAVSWLAPTGSTEITPTYDLGALAGSTGGWSAVNRYRWDPTVPTFVSEATGAIATTTGVEGAILRHPITGTPADGTSLVWIAAPEATLRVQKAGSKQFSAAIFQAEPTKGVQLRALFRLPGAIALVGERPGATDGATVPTLWIHREEPGTQSGASNWSRFDLGLPASLCANAAAVVRGGASAPAPVGTKGSGSILIGGSLCSGKSGRGGFLLARF